MAQQRLKLLALDGGGVRGLASLLILERLMKGINRNNPPKPCEVFDLIGGTSTGGLKMSVKDCITAYLKMSNDVFSKKAHRVHVTWKGESKTQARFDTLALERAIEQVIKDAGSLNPSQDLMEEETPTCKVLVCASQGENRDIVQFANFTTRSETSWVTILEAARATSAASTFFDPIVAGPYGQIYLDGATGANNPINEIWTTAEDTWPQAGLFEDAIQCFVSIGTGKPGSEAFGDTLVEVANTLLAIATETERTHEIFANGHRKLRSTGRYVRLNVDSGLENVGLEESSKVPVIASCTSTYLAKQDVRDAMLGCIQKLATDVLHVRESPLLSELNVPQTNPIAFNLSTRRPNLTQGERDKHFARAVARGDINEIQRCFCKSSFPRPSIKSQNEALFIAAKRGLNDILHFLLNAEDGARLDVNVKVAGSPLGTPLHAAAAGGYIDTTKMLLSFKADPNMLAGRYSTALHAAVNWNRRSIVCLLIEAKADINAPSKDFRHVIGRAVSCQHWDIVNELTSYQIDWSLVSKSDLTAIKNQYNKVAQQDLKSTLQEAH